MPPPVDLDFREDFADFEGEEEEAEGGEPDDFDEEEEEGEEGAAGEGEEEEGDDTGIADEVINDEDAEGEKFREAPDIEKLKDRIKQCVAVLSSKEVKKTGHSRAEFMDVLKADLMNVYDYSEWLMGYFVEMFKPAELVDFIQANENQRPLTIRVNTLKVKRRDLIQSLTKRGVHLEPLEKWSKEGIQVFDSQVPISGTSEYLGGHYMIQSAASFLPVLALDPKEKENVLDMCAAPGGKTSHIGQLMKNTGIVFANDVSKDRLKSLQANIHRLGVSNTVVSAYDGLDLPKHFQGMDRILLDAPCTGTGVMSRDPHIKGSKTEADVRLCSNLQKRLIIAAVDCLKVGGTLVYSTCSLTVEENECVVDYILKKRYVKIVNANLPFGKPGFTKYRQYRFHPSVGQSMRYYPHVHNLDGFFVCKILKEKHGVNKESKWYIEPVKRKRKIFADKDVFMKNKKRKLVKLTKHREKSLAGQKGGGK